MTDEKIDQKIQEQMKKAHYITIEEMEALMDKKMKLQKDFDKKVQTGQMELIGELAKQLSLALQRIGKLEKKLATYSEISTEIQEIKQQFSEFVANSAHSAGGSVLNASTASTG